MNELAKELNETLKGSVVYDLLSDYGKRMYFPKGIVAQSAQAKAKATRYNATVGQAFKNGSPLYLDEIYDTFNKDKITPSEIFTYAPGGGLPQLKELWREDMLEKNPSLQGKSFSIPVVTGGLTQALSIILRLFLDEDDTVILPHLFWDNYDLIIKENVNASFDTFPLYDETNQAFNIKGFKEAIENSTSKKIVVILNFPNNPTGYTPTNDEMDKIAEILINAAKANKKVLAICDDAYFGLFYEENTARESLFAKIADAHENLFAVKGDGATKEAMVWGFRVGFITVSTKNFSLEQYDAFNKKVLSSIRSSVSNCSKPSQSLLIKALSNKEAYNKGKEEARKEMELRYRLIKDKLKEKEAIDYFKPLAFNSGYFLSFECKGDVEELRLYLLEKYNIGAINIMNKVFRVAYCSVDTENLSDLFDIIYKAAGELWT
ncbi:MAG: aminotransferase class I/II-fold pyridoxal phosphate-dependent enzyme [Spirochaetia bacterium]|nr:aminotransferase class I/II-fold pyridoxal phosphate-dependent enzyme [Spirochaetia bacterium]